MKHTLVRSFAVAGLFGTAACAGGTAASPAAVAPVPEPKGSFEVVGRGPVTQTHTSDLWVFQGVDGRDYAYTGTWGACQGCYGDRLYVWDVTEPSRPTLTDSVVVDARVVNDVKVNEAGTLAVITRESASSRRNGIVVLDLADPAHPTIASEYWETLTGGVHNTFIDGDLVYAVHNGTSDVHVIDISNPREPHEVGRWGVPAYAGKYLHDINVLDGLAYVSYWDDGLIVLDVGNGIKGGTPQKPEFVSQYRYRTEAAGQEWGNTHVALPYTNKAGNKYVFVGDEIFPPDFDAQRSDTHPYGYVHVVDVSDIENPQEVARYEVPNAGVHNLWVENDTLYNRLLQRGAAGARRLRRPAGRPEGPRARDRGAVHFGRAGLHRRPSLHLGAAGLQGADLRLRPQLGALDRPPRRDASDPAAVEAKRPPRSGGPIGSARTPL